MRPAAERRRRTVSGRRRWTSPPTWKASWRWPPSRSIRWNSARSAGALRGHVDDRVPGDEAGRAPGRPRLRMSPTSTATSGWLRRACDPPSRATGRSRGRPSPCRAGGRRRAGPQPAFEQAGGPRAGRRSPRTRRAGHGRVGGRRARDRGDGGAARHAACGGGARARRCHLCVQGHSCCRCGGEGEAAGRRECRWRCERVRLPPTSRVAGSAGSSRWASGAGHRRSGRSTGRRAGCRYRGRGPAARGRVRLDHLAPDPLGIVAADHGDAGDQGVG